MRHMLKVFQFVLLAALAGQVLAVDEQCPEIDCDCDAFTSSPWESLCQAHQKTIVEQCIKANGVPQTYCRLQGPSATPVALSLQPRDLEPLASLTGESIAAGLEQLQAAEWSLLEDIKAAESYLAAGDISRLDQVVRIVESTTLTVFNRQRQLAQGLAEEQGSEPGARKFALKLPANEASGELGVAQIFAIERNEFWRGVANRLEAVADDLQVKSGQLQATEQGNASRIAYRIARRAATVLEFNARLLAEAGQYQPAARALQQAAGISEQLVTRSLADQAAEKFTRFYREQAAARWHRATYYWSVARNEEESQISFENAGQTLAPTHSDDAPSGVAGAEDKAARP